MTTYAGAIGALYAIEGAQQSIAESRTMSLQTVLGGRRVAQLGAKSPRAWSFAVPRTSASSLSRLQVLRQSQPMPWVWLSSWATRTNMLLPDQTAFRLVTMSGGSSIGSIVDLEGGLIAVSFNDPTPPLGVRNFASNIPVVPGVPLTAGVHARPAVTNGTITLRASFVDANGNGVLDASSSKTAVSFGPLTRVTVTATPPSNAVSCYLVASNHAVLAGPSVSYTSVPMGWAVGAGCMTAVVDGLDLSVVTAQDRVGGQEATYTFTVTEVG